MGVTQIICRFRPTKVSILNNLMCKHFVGCHFYSTKKSELVCEQHFDIIVAGGGMIGATLACTLGQNSQFLDKKILLLEASTKKEWTLPKAYSNRVSSLNLGSQKLLKKINVWKHIQAARFAIVKKMQIWDALSEAMITFSKNGMEEDIAYVVENDVLLNGAFTELLKLKNVEVVYGAKIKEYNLCDHERDVNQLTLENGNKFSCDLLLGCDGANSQVRKAMNVEYISWKYNQTGIVATLHLSEEINNVVAWQRFLPSGPIALLPLTKNMNSLVWSTTPEHAQELLSLTDRQFVDVLNENLWKQFKKSSIVENATKSLDTLLKFVSFSSTPSKEFPPTISACEEKSRAAFPLGFGHSTNYISKGVALVGDAAHRIHPLAGQGVNLGFGDITCLNNFLGDAVYSGNELGELSYLKKYESERQKNNLPIMLAVEGLYQLYNTDFTPFVFLRSLGLQTTNAINPLKNAIISYAS